SFVVQLQLTHQRQMQLKLVGMPQSHCWKNLVKTLHLMDDCVPFRGIHSSCEDSRKLLDHLFDLPTHRVRGCQLLPGIGQLCRRQSMSLDCELCRISEHRQAESTNIESFRRGI